LAQKNTAAKVAAPVAGRPKVFGPDQCHHRNAAGAPDCKENRLKSANLCKKHEAVWQAEAKKRREERIASGTTAPNAKKPSSAGSSKATVKAATPKRAKDANPASGKTPTRNPVERTTAKPHPMSVLRAPVQRQPSAAAELIAKPSK
jgi:hypothetical protein